MKIGIIYKATSPSGKSYIGKTTQTLYKRKSAHYYSAFNSNSKAYNYTISKAIRKYNSDIEWTILYTDISVDKLNKLEIEEIKRYGSFESGYNSTKGGEGRCGFSLSKESRKKMSDAHKGHKHSEETRKKMSKNSGSAKLNFKIAKEIRTKYATKKYSHRKLAKEYNVGKTTIGSVLNNTVWSKA